MESRLLRLRVLLPIAALAVTLVIADKIRLLAGVSDIPLLHAFTPADMFSGESVGHTVSAQESAARLTWAAPLAVFACLWVAVMCACLVTLQRLTPHAARTKWIAALIIAIIVMLLAFGSPSLTTFLTKRGEDLAIVAVPLFAIAVARASSRAIVAGLCILLIGVFCWVCNGWPLSDWAGASPVAPPNRQLAMVAPPFDTLLAYIFEHCGKSGSEFCSAGLLGLDRVVGGLDLIAVALLALTVAMIILEDPLEVPEQAELKLARQQSEMQRLLYLAASLLAVSILFTKTYQAWPQALLRDEDLRKSLRLVADSWLMLTGTYWTLILASLFLPLALIMSQRCSHLAIGKVPGGTPKAQADWLLASGYKFSLREQFLAAISLLAPWLAGGPLGTLMSQLKPMVA